MSPAAGCVSTSAIVAETATGWHVLKIECYSATKGRGVGNYIKSSAFDVGGRSWYIEYYPDGYDENSVDYISLFLQANIYSNVEVRARYKISLLKPDGTTISNYTRADNRVRTFEAFEGWGFPEFIQRKELEEHSTCLKDDCFSVRCDVTVVKVVGTNKATKQFVVVPPSELHKNLGWLLSSGEGADVTFEVSDGLFKAHRNILAARSSVFRAELYGPTKEKTTDRVLIGDMEPRVFKALLHFVYNDSLPTIVRDEETVMAQHLFVAADRYDLKRLKLICEDKLCSSIDRRTVATTLTLAEQHGCKRLREFCVTYLLSPGNLNDIIGTDEYKDLKKSCPSLVNELVAKLSPNAAADFDAKK